MEYEKTYKEVDNMSLEQLKKVRQSLLSDRKFYKKIIEEPDGKRGNRRKEDAQEHLSSIARIGKKIDSLLPKN
jgi:hypothetical protein